MIKGMFYVDGSVDGMWDKELYIEKVRRALKTVGYSGEGLHIYFISAANGDSYAYSLCEAYRKEEKPIVVVTSCSLLFSFHKFIWDPEKGIFNLWMWKDDDNMGVGEFVHVNDLAEREFREYHNIWKMWRNGALDIWRSWENDPEA